MISGRARCAGFAIRHSCGQARNTGFFLATLESTSTTVADFANVFAVDTFQSAGFDAAASVTSTSPS